MLSCSCVHRGNRMLHRTVLYVSPHVESSLCLTSSVICPSIIPASLEIEMGTGYSIEQREVGVAGTSHLPSSPPLNSKVDLTRHAARISSSDEISFTDGNISSSVKEIEQVGTGNT